MFSSPVSSSFVRAPHSSSDDDDGFSSDDGYCSRTSTGAHVGGSSVLPVPSFKAEEVPNALDHSMHALFSRYAVNKGDPFSVQVTTPYQWHSVLDAYPNEHHSETSDVLRGRFGERESKVLVGVSGGLLDFACAMKASKVCLIDSNPALPSTWMLLACVLHRCCQRLGESRSEEKMAELFMGYCGLSNVSTENIFNMFNRFYRKASCGQEMPREEFDALWVATMSAEVSPSLGSWRNFSNPSVLGENLLYLHRLFSSGGCYFFTRDLSEPGWAEEINRDVLSEGEVVSVFHLSNVLDYVENKGVRSDLAVLKHAPDSLVVSSVSGNFSRDALEIKPVTDVLGTVKEPKHNIWDSLLGNDEVWAQEASLPCRREFKFRHAMTHLFGAYWWQIRMAQDYPMFATPPFKEVSEAVSERHLWINSHIGLWLEMLFEYVDGKWDQTTSPRSLLEKKHVHALRALSESERVRLCERCAQIYVLLDERTRLSITRTHASRLLFVYEQWEDGFTPEAL
jgi:hypothetical protein